MTDSILAPAIQRFVSITQDVADCDLDRPWRWHDYDSEGVRFAFFRTYEDLRELAVKLRKERAAIGSPQTSSQLILSDYHAAYNDLQAALIGFGADLANRAPADNEWTVRRALAHIVGADLGFYIVVRYALDAHRLDDKRPGKISDDAWDAIAGMDEAAQRAILEGAVDNLRAYHRDLHERVLREFADIREDELEKPSMYWEDEPMTLRFRLHRFDSHMRQHTVQIDKTAMLAGHAPTEARRLLRLIYGALAEAEGALIGAFDLGENSRRDVAGLLDERSTEIAGILE